MQNYKVKVQNHSEGMEAQDLFLKMGFRKELFSYSGYPKLVVTDIDSIGGYSSGAEIGYFDADKITLQELRAMVAPKQKEYLVKTDTGYVLHVLSDVVDGHNGIIEVPEGADTLAGGDNCNYFWKHSDSGKHGIIGCGESLSRYPTWDSCEDSAKEWLSYFKDQHDMRILWQRKESLNDQVASAEEYRKSFTHTPKATLDVINNMQNAFEKAQNAINVQNAMAKLFTYPQYLSGVVHGKEFIVKPNQKSGGADHGVEQAQTREVSECDLIDSGKLIIGGFGESFPVGLEHHKFIQPEELPFVDDELKGVDATLAEREAQYGSFIGVANTTGQLMSVLLNSKNGQTLPYAHQEALHMICSKMARIVNGDHNHIDSWHDICGYAKLIENNIK